MKRSHILTRRALLKGIVATAASLSLPARGHAQDPAPEARLIMVAPQNTDAVEAVNNPQAVALPSAQFLHRAHAASISNYWTRINHVITDSNPYGVVLATPNWNPAGSRGTYDNHNIGVWYDGTQWAIFNQDSVAMPPEASFNILIPRSVMSYYYAWRTTSANIVSNWTYIDDAIINDDPNAIVFATPNWNANNGSGVYNDHPIGVWYSNATKKWAVFNQDLAAMPVNASFNLMIPKAGENVAFVHVANSANISAHWTTIDHPRLNNRPNAMLIVTPNWNPGGVGGTSNNHPTGVRYTGSRWAIFNQDHAAMPADAAFNVLLADNRALMPMMQR